MPSATIQSEQFKALPLWAQVLMASRLLRRAIFRLPEGAPERTAPILLAGCDEIERCAMAGGGVKPSEGALRLAGNLQPTTGTMALATAMHYAVDCAAAAEAANDFGAADAACSSSAGQSMMWSSQADGITEIQATIYAAIDLDLLKFACAEARVGKYDALGKQVMSRLVPILPSTATRPRTAASPAS